MVKLTDLQDNLSKTQAVERIFDNMRQHPDNEQREFAQQVQQNLKDKNDTVEQLETKDDLELSTNLEKENTREEQKKGKKKKKKGKDERGQSGDSIIDITI